MSHKYLGDLPVEDPLHYYLREEIFPSFFPGLSHHHQHPTFRVFRFYSANNKVFLYEEKTTCKKIIGKFFRDKENRSTLSPSQRAQREFHNLLKLRNFGFTSHPHHIVKPYAYNENLCNLLLEEYIAGDSLGKIIQSCLSNHHRELLYRKLSALAYFMATMHNRTSNGLPVDFNQDCEYFFHLIEQLRKLKGLSPSEADGFLSLCQQWKERPNMWEDQQVLVHGDATPPNFIMGSGLEVTAIDLERMKYADRIFDVGRMVGELQHYFITAGKPKVEAEPFIGHFLWEYASHFPDQPKAFHSITERLPFQIAITLLRIARNSWISKEYCRQLIKEAKKTLKIQNKVEEVCLI
jgi:thiamine kinase-like enzyme